MSAPPTRDLVVLVADNKIEAAIQGICLRGKSLGFRKLDFSVQPHPQHDSGCFLTAHFRLRPFVSQFAHALVIFDKDGCGKEQAQREDLEVEVEARLSSAGWDDRAKAIVIDPELEAWVWSDSPHVAEVLGWESGDKALRDWLVERGWCCPGQVKPLRPKEAYEAVLRRTGMGQSAGIYRDLAEAVSLGRCTDLAFVKLKTVLQQWFGTP